MLHVINYCGYVLLVLTVISPLFHLSMAIIESRKKKDIDLSLPQKNMTILIPCFNEQSILQTTVKGLKSVNYHNYNVIFINDGSSDNTMKVLQELLSLDSLPIKNASLQYELIVGYYQSKLYPNIYVLDKYNGGKADSLNAGIDYSENELVITLDADTILDKNALIIVNQNFNNKVIAAGGNVRILQGYTPNLRTKFSFNLKHIVRFQIMEYMKGFSILKSSLARLNAMVVISGAFGVFNRELLIQLGGYRKTVGEDIDITLQFHQYIMKNPEYKMIFIPEAICYTECPENWKDLYKQRIRWQKAFIDCIIKYRSLLLKTFLKKPVSFFMLADSFLVGTIATFTSLCFLLIFILTPLSQWSPFMIVLFVYSFVINIAWDISAIIINKNMGARYSTKDGIRFFTTIILDLIFFKLIGSIYTALGTILYFKNKEGWNKVQRTSNIYEIQQVTTGV